MSGIVNILEHFWPFNRYKCVVLSSAKKDFIMDKLKKVMRRDKDEKTEEAGILEVKS